MIAEALAKDRGRQGKLWCSLHKQVAESRLYDGRAFVSALEDIYRQIASYERWQPIEPEGHPFEESVNETRIA